MRTDAHGKNTDVPNALLIGAIVALSGLAGAFAPVAPTGNHVVDHVLAAILAGACAWAGATAAPLSLAPAAVAIIVCGGNGPLHLLGLATLGGTLALEVFAPRSSRGVARAGAAVVAGAAAQGLLRLAWDGPALATAGVAAIGFLPIFVSAFARATRTNRRRLIGVLVAGGCFGALACASLGYVAYRTDEILDEAQHASRAGVAATSAGDRASAAADFARADTQFREARNLARAWWARPGRYVPVLAPQLRSLDRVSALGMAAATAAQRAVTRVDPEKLRFIDGRIDLATLARDQGAFVDAARTTGDIATQLDGVSSPWLAPPLQHAIARFQRVVENASSSAQTAADALRIGPAVLGGHGARTYLVIFVTPAESRGSGGLIANYGVLRAVDGRIHLDQVGRGPDLDRAGALEKQLVGLADYQARYSRFDVANTWENVTMSPDFPTVAQAIAQLFPQSGGTHLDGVIRMGPDALAALAHLTGPINVPGVPLTLTSQNLVRFLVHDEYTLIPDQALRSNLLGDIARATFDALTSGRSPRPDQIATTMSPVVRTQDLAVWLARPAEEQFVERIGADAAVPKVVSDSFGATVQNGAGNKVDTYLHRTVDYAVTVDGGTGRATATATLTLRNDAPHRGEPTYIIGNPFHLRTGTNRAIVSLYSPLELHSAQLGSSALHLSTERELGRNVWWTIVDVPPGGTRTITLQLAGAVDLSSGSYRFDYLPQVLANADDVTVHLNVVHARTAEIHQTKGVEVERKAHRVTAAATQLGRWYVDVSLRR